MTSLIQLNSGRQIPQVGLGVFQTAKQVTRVVVKQALEVGYRHIDSAAAYGNEAECAQAILEFLSENPQIKRADIFFTTKVWEKDHGYDNAKAAIAKSLEQIAGLGYIDLLLIHTPRASTAAVLKEGDDASRETVTAQRREKRLGTWKAFQEAVEQGAVKSVGVSNYGIQHLQELLDWDGLKIVPAVNQVELHPWLQRQELVAFGLKHGIHAEAYSPLTRGAKLADPALVALSEKYNKTPAQILIRWSLQRGFITLPKSVNYPRIVENFDVHDFELAKEDVENLGDKTVTVGTLWDPTLDP